MTGTQRRVAVFDLDETLTRRDTFLPFLFGHLQRHPWRVWVFAPLVIRLLAFWHWGDRTWVKRCFLVSFLGGLRRDALQPWAHAYAQRVVQNELRPRSLAQLQAHQSAGDRVILATASFDIYILALAEQLGIHEVIASRVAWDERNRLCGITGDNCRDQEKLDQVRALLGPDCDPQSVVAYSDSHADLPLLAWAGEGVAVSPTPQLAARTQALGLRTEQW